MYMFLAFGQCSNNIRFNIPRYHVLQTGWNSVRQHILSGSRLSINRKREMSTRGNPPPVSTNLNATSIEGRDNDCDISSKLFSFCRFVKLDSLTDEEKLIHSRHVKALEIQQEMYEDPSTGYLVLTRLAHLKRGKCCGNACRHCPYSHTAVPVGVPKKTYNSAFFV